MTKLNDFVKSYPTSEKNYSCVRWKVQMRFFLSEKKTAFNIFRIWKSGTIRHYINQ